MREEEYIVELDTPGCGHCGANSFWRIVNSDDCATSTSYGDKELAEDICDLMNDAYKRGVANVQKASV